MDNTEGTKQSGAYLLPVSILIGAVLISGAVIYSTGLKTANNKGGEAALGGGLKKTPQIESTDVILGDPKAKVTLIEYGDYQCPFCGRFFKQIEPLIREEYVKTGKVKMVWKDFVFLGPESEKAALAAHCAAEQGKFWEYHDAILSTEANEGWKENNGNLTDLKLQSLASNLSLDSAKFKDCLLTEKYKDQIKKSYDGAVDAGVKATPTVFIGETKIEGLESYSVFKQAIDNLLNEE